MKRLLLLAPLVLGLAGCASQGGGGGGAAFLDCYTDYCVGYDAAGSRRLYLRTPAGPAIAPRGEVSTAQERAAGTQVVARSTGPGALSAVRMSPIPARPPSPTRSGGHRP
jgi:hypothetical protein